jgi:hypothetical protein
MAKRNYIISWTCLLAFLCFISTNLFGETISKQISAYKYADFITASEVRLNITDQSVNDILPDDTITISTSALLNEQFAFSWEFSGNHPGTLTLSFTFTPMVRSTAQNPEWLPYVVRLNPATTTIAGTTIPETGTGTVGPFNHGGVEYRYREAKLGEVSATLPQYTTGATVEGSSAILDLTYQLITTPNPASTVDHWIRKGSAYVSLHPTATQAYDTYVATMIVGIIAP